MIERSYFIFQKQAPAREVFFNRSDSRSVLNAYHKYATRGHYPVAVYLCPFFSQWGIDLPEIAFVGEIASAAEYRRVLRTVVPLQVLKRFEKRADVWKGLER